MNILHVMYIKKIEIFYLYKEFNYNNTIIKNMSQLFKQLNAVHLLPLPTDMIRVIKSFVVDDRVSYKSKKRKNVMSRTINDTPYSCKTDFNKKDEFLFWISDDERCPQFQSGFCISCGNYISYYSLLYDIDEKIRCSCV